MFVPICLQIFEIVKHSHEFLISSTAAKRSEWKLSSGYMIQRYTNTPQVNCSCKLLACRSPQDRSLVHVWILAVADTHTCTDTQIRYSSHITTSALIKQHTVF